MKQFIILVLALSLSACIPLRKAPEINQHKVMDAKKFKRKLPRETAFIFEDPKDANAFYNFINSKYNLNHFDVGIDTPIQIGTCTYYLNYYEAEIPDKTFNLFGFVVDAKLEQNDMSPIFDDAYVTRHGHWYIAITAHDSDNKNCLTSKHPDRKKIHDYLKMLRSEYLNTSSF